MCNSERWGVQYEALRIGIENECKMERIDEDCDKAVEKEIDSKIHLHT
jgi:hypothetical protein